MIAFIRNRSIRSIAAVAATLSATMEDAPAEPKNDDEFIKQFSAKMDAKEKAAAAGEGDEGKPKPVSKKEEVADDDASAGGGEEEEADDEVETEGEEAEVEASGEEEGEDGGDDDEEEDDSEFGKRAKDAKLPTSIDDLPEAARPLVAKRLKEMESGFTRLMQKQAEFRQERRQFQVEERYRATHKVEWLTQELMKDPDLEAQVAEQLEKLRDESPYREAAGVLAKDHRAKAAKDIADQEAEERKEEEARAREDREQAEWIAERGSKVEALAKKACTKFGIQFDRGVEAAIAYEISESEQGDIDDERIRDIVEEMAAERGRSKRAVAREERKRIVQGKTDAQRRASPIRPGQGRAGGTTNRSGKEPTLEQQMTASAERLFPGEP